MKHKEKVNPFLRISVFSAVLVLLAAAVALGLFYYLFGITEPEGLSLASWPKTFTSSFSVWMENRDGSLWVEDIAIERLDKYGLWLQVIDGDGQEVFSHNKPEDYPDCYSASELLAFSEKPYENGNTVFAGSFDKWSYLIGFPYPIGKYMLYYNGKHVTRLFSVFCMGLYVLSGAVIIFVFSYGFWLTGRFTQITRGIGGILRRSYSPVPEKGIFREVFSELNKMNTEICNSDKVQKDTERTRQEWITGITHDLKTPLSPVKGYAELLSDASALDSETVREYGKIILKNISHAESLINDLKLTYQLEAGVIPFHPKEIPFVRFLREVVIDIVNDPAFSCRRIEFYSDTEEITVSIDADLFRRAMENLIVNALTHNPPETKVTVTVSTKPEGNVSVIVKDNGAGMDSEEAAELFTRYYRGTSTKEKPEGSGLGLAIAKQIITLHGGDIRVTSSGEGTEMKCWIF